jgi:hypothetical protein
VVGLDVRDHRDARRQRQERAVVLVRLDDEARLAAELEVAAPRAHAPADHAGGLEPGGRERLGGQHRGRGLPVRARDPDRQPAGDRLGERLRAADHRQARGARGGELGVVLGNGRRDHHGARVANVRRVVPLDHVHPERAQIVGAGRVRVAPGDPRATSHEQLGEGAHPSAGDADEVDRAGIRGEEERHGGAAQYGCAGGGPQAG